MMSVRQASASDIKKISNIHIVCFPDSFSTQLGEKLLNRMYLEYLLEAPELFLVAEQDDELIGFVMGYYYDGKDSLGTFKNKNKIAIALKTVQRLLQGNRAAWRKLKSMLNRGTLFKTVDSRIEEYEKSKMADLLSICVKKEYRGKGTANQLIQTFENEVRKAGRKVCTLTVADENGRGIRFYEKNGYSVCREAKGCKTYYKQL